MIENARHGQRVRVEMELSKEKYNERSEERGRRKLKMSLMLPKQDLLMYVESARDLKREVA